MIRRTIHLLGPNGPLREWAARQSRPLFFGIAILIVVTVGTVGYMVVGDITFDEALYQAVITVSTVGYSDKADTTLGRLFSVFYIVAGVCVVSAAISSLAAALVEGRIREVLGRRRMQRQINELKDHLILCGYGRFGQITAAEIMKSDVPLVVIDHDEHVINDVEKDGLLGLLADATEEDTLEKAGLAHARALLCTLPTDAENVYAILNARETREDISIVAIARDRRAERKLMVAGATHVVSPYTIGATHMARQILTPHVANVVNLVRAGEESGTAAGVRMEEVLIEKGSPLDGVALKDSPIRRDFGVMVVAVVEENGESAFNPGPDVVIKAGDTLVSVGPGEGLKQLKKGCGQP